jgi:hypothetical protein
MAELIPELDERTRQLIEESDRWHAAAENDFDDIAHSSVAVAYTDVFLTERSFAEVLNRPAVQSVITPTKCHLVSSVSDALVAVSKIVPN